MEKGRLRKTFRLHRKKLEVDFTNLSQQMYQRNLELADSNQALSLLRAIDGLVLDSHDELGPLCQNIAHTIIEQSSYPLVAIMANPLHKKSMKLMGLAAENPEALAQADIRLDLDNHSEWLGGAEQSIALDVKAMSDSYISKKTSIDKKIIAEVRPALGVQSAIVVKLQSRQQLVGLMIVGLSQEKDNIQQKDRVLLDRLSEVMGIALDSRLLSEENKQVLRQLQLTNEKLKQLDETKDEFISMASHQLRTPLTSVKGYVSMVLEGDAGPLNDMQKKLLEQSFISSQRMVYLIADLLNLSRLKTGKFVIEAVPTNLAEVIEGEVQQLKETAAGKNMTLVYKAPKSFPTLMLDETKIRQVIMNFVDNAIYYTPTGGKIEIHLVETDKSVEFTVTDNGIGVPEAEQHHLFTKFFRAKNAQKARPDGTGLGLFMAKKVIVAQGGALIFSSTVGKGSTFGFSFLKVKLEVDQPAKELASTS